MKSKISALFLALIPIFSVAQSYAPAAGLPGSTAIHKNSPLFVQWANGITVERGLIDKSNPAASASGSSYATFGLPNDALGSPSGSVVSLGDGGFAILTFATPISNRPGFDFAVFENGSTAYLELAFVEVSSDGVHYFRFQNHSQTQTQNQLSTFASPEATYINNLAGKYSSEYGTPFNLDDLPENELLDKSNILYVKVIDVVGSINPVFASYDSYGNAINDSFPTPFNSGGFDLQGVGVLDMTLSSANFDKKNKIALYPNPSNGVVYLSNAQNAGIEIVDLNGRKVITVAHYQQQAISISHFSKGVYLVIVTVDENAHQIKLIVN
ncbi:T9SS type A sorting domain-containing protein [Flavobacterium tegetincola]|uniref:T9SS type A sorting domain-containing protein n=1 Tax=Flavobacterium tegetincola TaxID=150172 RepID=UPI0003FA6EEB|nr:T9SS type A sorting domain-containing protein [Flavobacterium tegetincola]